MSLIHQIEKYYADIHQIKNRQDIDTLSHSSVGLSLMIASYAHKEQYRKNGEPYILHPLRIMEHYKDLIGLTNKQENFDINVLEQCNLPFKGVMELCLLHDVVEDTNLSLADIQNIFNIKGLENYFQLYIKDGLQLLTHQKDVDYDTYISRILTNRLASLVKVLDMYNNTNYLTLGKIDEESLKKIQVYQKYFLLLCLEHKFNLSFAKYNEYRKVKGWI